MELRFGNLHFLVKFQFRQPKLWFMAFNHEGTGLPMLALNGHNPPTLSLFELRGPKI